MEKYSNKTNKFSIEQVVTLDIDSTGSVTQRLTNLETTLENTLLNALYPGIKVAVVNVPNEPLDAYEESQVENAMANLKFKNTPYKLVGASGSSKDGKFYFVDKDHSQSIAERFQHWPQAAIVYFGILVSSCKVVIEEPDVSVLVVEDHVLGTNDFGGRISQNSNCLKTASISSVWRLKRRKPKAPSRLWRMRRRSCSTPTLFSQKAR
jgi:hypothetical protein